MSNKGVGGRKPGRGGRVEIGGVGGVGGVFGAKRAERDLVLRMIWSMRLFCGGVKGKRVLDVSPGFHFRVEERACFGAWGWCR